MTNSDKPISFDSLSLTCDNSDTNKPDFRQLDLGSPVSTLRTGPAASSSSSSSGSVSGRTGSGFVPANNSHSGELSAESSPSKSPSPTFSGNVSGSRGLKTGFTRSDSRTGGFLQTHVSGSSVTSPAGNVLPAGNILPAGKVMKTGLMVNRSKPDVLSLGTGNYGHGSIMRGDGGVSKSSNSPNSSNLSNLANSSSVRRSSMDPEELKRLGNESYKKGCYIEALSYYDKAISMVPGNASYHCNRAAVLMCLNRLNEAVKECYEAIKLDNGYIRAHHRLGSLLISLGQVENARKHLCFPGYQPDPNELRKLLAAEKHLNKCTDLRRIRDWSGVLRESDAAIMSGADACTQLFACKSEALLKLRQLDEADLNLLNAPKFEASCSLSCSQTKFFGMLSEAYLLFVRAQIDMALGRFENAITSIEKSGHIDPRNVEVAVLLQNVRSVSRARNRGNELFKSERLTEACSAYAEGLRLDPSNPVLYCNRAACWFKLGQFEKSLEDCNQALLIHPNYTKALLRRAATLSKLDKWAESVKDYEILRKELPNNNDIAESLFHAQVALKKSRGEDVNNMKFGGEVELITDLEQFKAAVASSGASVVLYKLSSDIQCKQITPLVDTICTRYPSINFLKVDLEESPLIANAENVRVVPTIKIYKKGNRVKEMVCPSPEVLEASLRHYSF
ncbi:thioredoxin-like fold, N-terminal acetyltransferase A, auxiliary subunit [Artemisia annua]|uniref:Thioredoxin-like fold, N-terminal acetyltransferase A, auxiliary subunit n=1 Tax=Artemisia annua TaxID=35608 RepID=A0A2U1MZN4_ARTAN|nr:thioredoxin-like fold, N-terminal acetyltransferase A, auxiliary subunit [Artemisia annua]